MAEEQFFPMFMKRLREEVKKLQKKKQPCNPFSQRIYKNYWNSYDNYEESDHPIIACDGSLGSSSFSGGVIFWVARAIAHTYVKENLVQRIPEVEVKGDYRLDPRARSLFMKAVELKTLKKTIQRAIEEYGKAFAIYDGSLYLTFSHHTPILEATKEVLNEYVRELSSLLALGMKDNVKILGVAKDSDISYLRSHIMSLELLKNEIGGLSLYRNIKQMREEIAKRGPLNSILLKDYVNEMQNDESDESCYDRLMNTSGFTTPLLLAPQTCYVIQEDKENRRHWSESRFRRSSSRTLVPLFKEIDKTYELPPIALTYWKPKHGLRTYRLDIPSNLLGYNIKCDDLIKDEFVSSKAIASMKDLVAILNWLDNEAYGIRPLVDVDEITRLIRSRYKSAYEPAIQEELKLHGLDFKSRKRNARDDLMRRY